VRRERKGPRGIVVIRKDPFELEIDKILGIKRTHFLGVEDRSDNNGRIYDP
jgi:hypothetical protein